MNPFVILAGDSRPDVLKLRAENYAAAKLTPITRTPPLSPECKDKRCASRAVVGGKFCRHCLPIHEELIARSKADKLSGYLGFAAAI